MPRPRLQGDRPLTPYERKKRWRKKHPDRVRDERKRYKEKRFGGPLTYIGIDGEGQGKDVHRYIFLAASTEDGVDKWGIENPKGLSTAECLDFICSIQSHVKGRSKLFAFSFVGYDLTKILTDLHNAQIYKLLRPELRTRKVKLKGGKIFAYHTPIWWQLPENSGLDYWGFKINLLSSKFTVQRVKSREFVTKTSRGRSKGRQAVTVYLDDKPTHIHDIFKFYQCKFTKALEDWKIGSEAFLSRMRLMKSRRSEFDQLSREDIKAYCWDECACMGELAHKLVDAHEAAGLDLTQFFGAGSSAKAIMKKMGIKEHLASTREVRKSDAPEIQEAVMSAFFGGRFENSVSGMMKGPLYSYDISSAYPYQLCFLPCFLHGKWKRTRKRADLETCTTALVRYKLRKPSSKKEWAPFPFRSSDGSVIYPDESAGGWLWKDEYLAGERLFDNAQFICAWAWHQDCFCNPFEQIPHYYRERCRIGKEGAGIVLKLGPNACYGSLAQAVGGGGAYTCWPWAGLITSGCRVQGLEVMPLLPDLSDLLMIATDGICTKRRLSLPTPRDTGTFDLPKPLGGWEEKVLESGLFLARPGIYFQPMMKKDETPSVIRGRGVGRSAVIDNAKKIIEAFERGDSTVQVANVPRFLGAKAAISYSPKHEIYTRSPVYGQWFKRPVKMSFDPLPKRERILPDGRLEVRSFPGLESVPYRKGLISPEGLAMIAERQQVYDQPDGPEDGEWEDVE